MNEIEDMKEEDSSNNASVQEDFYILSYVSISVDHALFLCFLHVVLVIICCFFALPLITLSNIDSGLRLRDDPIANLGDGYFALLKDTRPLGFGSGGVISADLKLERTYDERSLTTVSITLIWFTSPPSNIFTEENLIKMKELEDAIINTQTFQEELCKLETNGVCRSSRSAATNLLNFNLNLPLDQRVKNLYNQDRSFFETAYKNTDPFATKTRTTIFLGTPLKGFATPGGSKQNEKFISLMNQEIMPMIRARAYSSDGSLKLTYNQPSMRSDEAASILMRDFYLAFGAAAVSYFGLLFHMRSLFISIGAFVQVLSSFPITLFMYRYLFGITLFGGLQVLAVFIIIGIGVDDCFVLYDAFDQCTREMTKEVSIKKRLSKAFATASYSMFTTSLTTALCFASLSASNIPVLRFFGIFCSLLVTLNYFLCISMFLILLVLWERYIQQISCGRKPKNVDHHKSLVLVPIERNSWAQRQFLRCGKMITIPWCSGIIILIGFVTFGVSAYFVAALQPSKSIDAFFSDDHPLGRYDILNLDNYGGGGRATFRFVNGLKSNYRTGFDPANDDSFGTPIFDSDFNGAHPNVQQFMIDQCNEIVSNLTKPELSATGYAGCPYNEFQSWIISRGRPFPLENQTEFRYFLTEYLLQPFNSIGSKIGLARDIDGSYYPRTLFNEFGTDRSQRADSYEERVAVYSAWRAFENPPDSVPHLGRDGSIAPVDGFYEVWMQTQSLLISGSQTSIIFSFCVAFAIILFGTKGDIYTAFVSTLSLGASVLATIATMVLLGWSLGAVEAVSLIILTGISVDYNIHMAVAHAETYGKIKDRKERVQEALRKLGISVFYGGATTFFACSILLGATIIVLNKFGTFVLFAVGYSLLNALLLQMAFLSLNVNSVPLFTGLRTNRFKQSITKICFIPEKFCLGIMVLILGLPAIVFLSIGVSARFIRPEVPVPLPPLPSFVVGTRNLSDIEENVWTQFRFPLTSPCGCAPKESEYAFFVYKSSDWTLNTVYLEYQGRANGVCASEGTCLSSSYSSGIDGQRFQRINANQEPFPFIVDKPRYYFYLPYCTGDAFLGRVSIQYSELLTIQHYGEINAREVVSFIKNQIFFENLKGILPPTIVLMGCGSGGIGALSTASWSVPEFKSVGVTNISLIADSIPMVSKTPSNNIEILAFVFWGATTFPDIDDVNQTLDGRILLASSAYDWFLTSAGGFGRNSRQYKNFVENSEYYQYLFRLHGDRHCVVLNPVNDRFGMDPKLEPVFKDLIGLGTSSLNKTYKCGDLSDPCELDADLRFS